MEESFQEKLVKNLYLLLLHVLDKNPASMQIVPVYPNIADHARQNDRHPAWVKINVPDEWVKNMQGYDNLKNLYLVIKIDRDELDTFEKTTANAHSGGRDPDVIISGPYDVEPVEENIITP